MPRSTIPMTMTPDSSTIAGYGFDAASGTMVLQFNSSKGQKEYEYPDTDPAKFAELHAAESKGSWWYKNKVNFPTFRVMQEDAPETASGSAGT